MRWYNYKKYWINLDKCYRIDCDLLEREKEICFYTDSINAGDIVRYDTEEERNAEFFRIKNLIGIKDYTSRCC